MEQRAIHVLKPVQELDKVLRQDYGLNNLGSYLCFTFGGLYKRHIYKNDRGVLKLSEPINPTNTYERKIDPILVGPADLIDQLSVQLSKSE